MKLHVSSDLTLPIEAVTQTFAILAKRGVGKTYTGAVMVEEMLAAHQQVVVADPVGVWWGLRSSADGKQPGFPIVVFGGEHGDLPLEEHAGEIVATAIVENGFSAVLDLSLFRKGQQVRFMTAFAETLYRLNRKPLHFVVDEADAFAPQRPMRDEARLLGAFEDIVRRGRARGLGVTLITQRAAVINKNVLTQVEVLVALRTISPQDREALQAWTEIHGSDREQELFWESLASLPIGSAWFWSPGWLDIFKLVAIRRRNTFDSSATPEVGKKAERPKALAEVNLEELGAQIKSTAEKAKENDPRELKRTIAELRRELTKAGQATSSPAKSELKRVEVPVLKESQIKAVEKAMASMDQFWIRFEATLMRVESALADVGQSLKKHQVKPVAVPSVTPQLPRGSVNTARADVMGRSNNGEISGGLRRMMVALAQRSPLNKRQLGVRSGLSSTSGTFGTYLGRARSNGWIGGEGDSLSLTPAGAEVLGSFEPLPEGMDLLGYWLKQLGAGGAARMLQVLAEKYPHPLTKEQLGELAQISHTSGTFGTYLGKLRTLELVEGRGELRASREFFE